jgi:hypothetical protein
LVLTLVPPVALEVTRTGSTVAAARGATASANCHALAPAVPATAAASPTLSGQAISAGRLGRRLILFTAGLLGGGIRARELEPGGGAFLLGDLSSFLRIREGEGVSSLVATASAPTGRGVLPSTVRGFKVAECTGRTGRRGRRGAHPHVRDCRLITAV